MNFALNPKAFRRIPGCAAEIMVAIWARTDARTAIAPNLSVRQIDADLGWGRPADVQRYLTRHIIGGGYLQKRVADNGVNEFTWTPKAVTVQAPIQSPRRADIVTLFALDEQRALALDEQRAHALDQQRAHALDDQRAHALDEQRAPRLADPYGNSSAIQQKNSAASAADGASKADTWIADLREAAAAADLAGSDQAERDTATALMREVGIDPKRIREILAAVPAEFVRSNIACCRKKYQHTKAGGGAFLKAICYDWAGWIERHQSEARPQAQPAIEAKPTAHAEPFAQLAVLDDATFTAALVEAINAEPDAQRRAAIERKLHRAESLRNSISNALVHTHLERLAATAAA